MDLQAPCGAGHRPPLDPQAREHIWAYVERMVEEEKITVVLTTHYMEEADRLCTRLAIVDEGHVVALDSPAKLKQVLGGDVVTLGVAHPDLDAVRALTEKELREDLICKGLKRAKQFSWEKAAQQTLEVYRKVGKQ